MDNTTKELVALASSVAAHCQPCFRHHLDKARKLGISEEDVLSAIGLAKRISAVGDQRMADFVDLVMKEGQAEEIE
jgi:AhpD family alkylhydroperoxidase